MLLHSLHLSCLLHITFKEIPRSKNPKFIWIDAGGTVFME